MGRWGRHAYLGDSQGRAPLVLEDVQADAAVRINVAVVDARREVYLRRIWMGQSVWVTGQPQASNGVLLTQLAFLKPSDKLPS
jgi:hypothetical protein